MPYDVAREVEDVAALIAHASGRAHLLGHSSGALLALHAAAAGLGVDQVVAIEPPLRDDSSGPDPLTGELTELVAAGDHDAVVERFMTSIEVPEDVIAGMRSSDSWHKMVGIAPSLVYDCHVSDAMSSTILRRVDNPVLVLDSAGSTDNLTGWAADAAARLPNATHRSLPGEWHGIADGALARAVIDFLTS